jgi:hypothetical protein
MTELKHLDSMALELVLRGCLTPIFSTEEPAPSCFHGGTPFHLSDGP